VNWFNQIQNFTDRIAYKPKFFNWLFVLSFIGISLLYQYHQILFFEPQSMHQWRQCDGLSFTLNYYQEDRGFFQPAIHSQEGDKGMSGETISEFPLIYWLVGNIWKITGQQEFIFRLISLLFFFFGLFYLFKMAQDFLKDSVWALFVVILLFTSPVLVFYANNFLMDIPAFGLALMGIYFFYQYTKEQKSKYLWLFFLVFTLGILLKLISAIFFVAVLGVFFIELITSLFFKNNEKVFKKPLPIVFGYLVSFAIIAAYYFYSRSYNDAHHNMYFLLDMWPVWEVSSLKIEKTFKMISDFWFKEYYSSAMLYLSGLLFIIIILFNKKINKIWFHLTWISFVGIIFYLMLFFGTLEQHDYHLINLYFIFPLIFVCFIDLIRNTRTTLFKNWVVKLAFLVFVLYNINYATENIKDRYWGWMNSNYKKFYHTLSDSKPYIRGLGINREDKVISIPDYSGNVTLYLLDQKGYTDYGEKKNTLESIKKKIDLGAKYLIINNPKVYEEYEIDSFLSYRMGNFKNIDIYDLRPYQ
jgi:hypothetical protein